MTASASQWQTKTGFGNLGGSWKQYEKQTRREKRLLHGNQGQGRVRAFAVRENLSWHSVYAANGSLREFKIAGNTSNKRQFTISDEKPRKGKATGTTVTLSNVIQNQGSLDLEDAVPELNKLFALYLKQYPAVRICTTARTSTPRRSSRTERTTHSPHSSRRTGRSTLPSSR